MLPVQTVMIRYMVLVYRWGRGWLGVAGDWEGFACGDGGADALAGGGCRYRARARKSPADEGPAGPFAIRLCFLLPRQIRLEVLQTCSCS